MVEITSVQLQISRNGNKVICVVFTNYRRAYLQEYDGFDVYHDEETAKEAAAEMVNRYDNDFQSIVNKYYLQEYDKNGIYQTTPIIVRDK